MILVGHWVQKSEEEVQLEYLSSLAVTALEFSWFARDWLPQ
jgi:hypothetical protein